MKIEEFYKDIKDNILKLIKANFSTATITDINDKQRGINNIIDEIVKKLYDNGIDYDLYINVDTLVTYNNFMFMYMKCILLYFYTIVIFNIDFNSDIYITNLKTPIKNIILKMHDVYLLNFLKKSNTYTKFKDDLENNIYDHLCKWIRSNHGSSILEDINKNIDKLISEKYLRQTTSFSKHASKPSNSIKPQSKIENITTGNTICDKLYEHISLLQDQIETVKRNHDLLKSKLNALENALLH